MPFTATPRARRVADRALNVFLRVPSAETLARLSDLEAGELLARRGHRRRVFDAVMADMDRRAGLERKQLAAEGRRERARAKRAAVRHEYDVYVHGEFLAAERECRGNLLSRDGKAADVDPIQLWTMPRPRAEKLASEELRDFWAVRPRVTFGEWQRQTGHQFMEAA